MRVQIRRARLRRTSALTAAAVISAALLAGIPLAAPASAAVPGPAGMFPSVVSATSASTLYVWGTNLQASTVELYCPVPNPNQPQATSYQSLTPFQYGSTGTWLAVQVPADLLTDPKSGAPAEGSCTVGIANAANSGVRTILVGGNDVLQVKNVVPALGAAEPASLLSTAPAGDPQTITITSPVDGPDLSAATVQQALCTGNRAATALSNAATPTAHALVLTPIPVDPSVTTYCALAVSLNDAASTVLLVPGTMPASGDQRLSAMRAITYQPPYTGPVRVYVRNDTGLPDTEIYVSLTADASAGGTASGFAGVNPNTLTTVAFTGLTDTDGTSTYDKKAHTAYFDVTNGLASGVVLVSSSTTTSTGTTYLATGDAPPGPATSPYRYAMFELTYSTNTYTDLTLIDQIGWAMSSSLYTDAPATGLPNKPLADSDRSTGCLSSLVDGLERIVPPAYWSTANPDLTGGVLRYDANGALAGYVGAAKKPAVYTTPDVQAYVQSVESLSPLTINDVHNSAQQDGTFAYTATYAGTSDTWTLSGTIQNGAATGPTLTVEGASIYGPGTHGGTGYALYGEDGPFRAQIGGTDYGWGNGSQVAGSGYQDLVKTIYRDFIAGFAYGYWGSTYPVPAVAGVASGTSTGPGAAYFTLDPRTHAYGHAGASLGAWNAYDALVREVSRGGGGASGAYGTAYSDTFLDSALSPAIGTNSARSWVVSVGDPKGCAAIAPTPQSLKLAVGQAVTVIPAGIQPPVGVTTDYVTPTATGFPAAPEYAITPKLPAGLVLDRTTGVVSGSPTVDSPRQVHTITARSGRVTATAYLTTTVGDYSLTPAVQNISGTVGQRASAATPAPSAYTPGGAFQGPVTYTVDPPLPGGLTMNSATGQIHGVMPTSASIAQPYRVTATDTAGGTGTATIWLTVLGSLSPSPQTVTGTVGTAVASTAFTPSGFGPSPDLSYSVVGKPALPPGLTIDPSTGVVSGTPAAVSSASVTVQATATVGTIAQGTITFAITTPTAPDPTPQPGPTPTPTPTHSCPAGFVWVPSLQACAEVD